MEILILLGLILLNGLFAMAEIALVTSRRSRLTALADAGDSAAVAALRLAEEPTKFLSTVQIGITSIGLLNGIVGEAVLAAPFALWLEGRGLTPDVASILSTSIVVIGVTYISIVAGELVPKRLGQLSPERIARLVARPMQWLALVTRPFVVLLTRSTTLLLKLLGASEVAGGRITEEEIHALLMEGREAGAIDQDEHAMVRNVFHLDDRLVGTMMIPRAEIEFLDLNAPLEENLRQMAESPHSRFPLCDKDLHEIIGLLHSKRVMGALSTGQPVDLRALAEDCTYVPQSISGMELLQQFRSSGTHVALVVDEYGDVKGLVTLHDLMEALTGELSPSHPDDSWAVQRQDGSWLLDGRTPIPELKNLLALRTVPEEARARYHTVSGMFIALLGQIPATASFVDWEGWRFEVVDMDGHRIDKILASRIDPR